MGVGSQRHAPAALPLVKTQVPIVEEDGWASGPNSTGVRKISSSLLFVRRTAQPVAGHYAVYRYKFEVVKDKLIREWCGLRNTLSQTTGTITARHLYVLCSLVQARMGKFL
jgi:hypothetical protein